LTPHVGADGYFVFALDVRGKEAHTHSRMFCPALGIPEDPVSGNAARHAGTYLVTHGMLKAARQSRALSRSPRQF